MQSTAPKFHDSPGGGEKKRYIYIVFYLSSAKIYRSNAQIKTNKKNYGSKYTVHQKPNMQRSVEAQTGFLGLLMRFGTINILSEQETN